MKIVNNVLIFLLVVLTQNVLPANAAPPRDLLAHGAGERFWIAIVSANSDKTNPGDKTEIRIRATGGSDWKALAQIARRVVSLANYGPELVAVLDNGDWMLIGEGRTSTGQSLPAGGKMIAVANDRETVWAIGLVPGGLAATRPVITQPASTSPATTPAASRFVLFSLDRSDWIPQAEIPDDLLPNEQTPVSMAIVDGRPLLAVKGDSGGESDAIRLHRLSEKNIWVDAASLELNFKANQFKLLSDPNRMILWAADQSGPGQIWFGPWTESKIATLKISEPIPQGSDRAIAIAFERIRLLFIKEGKVFEQAYDLQGNAAGPVVELTVPPARIEPIIHPWINWSIMVILTFVIISTLRRRKAGKAAGKSEENRPEE